MPLVKMDSVRCDGEGCGLSGFGVGKGQQTGQRGSGGAGWAPWAQALPTANAAAACPPLSRGTCAPSWWRRHRASGASNHRLAQWLRQEGPQHSLLLRVKRRLCTRSTADQPGACWRHSWSPGAPPPPGKEVQEGLVPLGQGLWSSRCLHFGWGGGAEREGRAGLALALL